MICLPETEKSDDKSDKDTPEPITTTNRSNSTDSRSSAANKRMSEDHDDTVTASDDAVTHSSKEIHDDEDSDSIAEKNDDDTGTVKAGIVLYVLSFLPIRINALKN